MEFLQLHCLGLMWSQAEDCPNVSGGFHRQFVHVHRVESPTTHMQATSQQGQLSSRDGPAAKDRRCQHRQEGNCLFYSQDQRLEMEGPKGAGTSAEQSCGHT